MEAMAASVERQKDVINELENKLEALRLRAHFMNTSLSDSVISNHPLKGRTDRLAPKSSEMEHLHEQLSGLRLVVERRRPIEVHPITIVLFSNVFSLNLFPFL